MTDDTDTIVDPLTVRLNEAWAAYAEASRTIVLINLDSMVNLIHAAHPDATQVRAEWSDQGDWLTPVDIDPDTDLDDDLSDDLYDVLGTFETGNRSHWEPFLIQSDDRHGRGRLAFSLARCERALEVLDDPETPLDTTEQTGA